MLHGKAAGDTASATSPRLRSHIATPIPRRCRREEAASAALTPTPLLLDPTKHSHLRACWRTWHNMHAAHAVRARPPPASCFSSPAASFSSRLRHLHGGEETLGRLSVMCVPGPHYAAGIGVGAAHEAREVSWDHRRRSCRSARRESARVDPCQCSPG